MEFVYPEEGAPALFATANVVKGAPNADLADAFLNYLVGKDAQQIVGEKIGFGPVNSEVVLAPEQAANVTYGADAAGKLVQLDWAVINEKRPEWTDRWNREIER
jgi:putative spermidine/putrescine transport system substrate-binding protein